VSIAYDQQAFDLLWDQPASSPAADSLRWLLRAAAELRTPGPAAHRDSLVAYYRDLPAGTPDPYFVMGRYMVGLSDPSALFALVHGQATKRRSEIAYYAALRAQHDGRWREAFDWYRVVVATRYVQGSEYHWAWTQLLDWSKTGKSLDVIARAAGRSQ
jgi:hypothetical protein